MNCDVKKDKLPWRLRLLNKEPKTPKESVVKKAKPERGKYKRRVNQFPKIKEPKEPFQPVYSDVHLRRHEELTESETIESRQKGYLMLSEVRFFDWLRDHIEVYGGLPVLVRERPREWVYHLKKDGVLVEVVVRF